MKKIVFCLIAILSMMGCSPMSSLMVPNEQASGELVASDSMATVVFLRPAFHGHLIDSAVFLLQENTEELVGRVSHKEGVAISVKPGIHEFMAVDQNILNPRFMRAEVEAGKIYHVVVSPRGWPTVVFALVPIKSQKGFKYHHDDLPGWLADTQWVKKSPEAAGWVEKNRARIGSTRGAYFQWKSGLHSKDPQFQLSKQDALPR